MLYFFSTSSENQITVWCMPTVIVCVRFFLMKFSMKTKSQAIKNYHQTKSVEDVVVVSSMRREQSRVTHLEPLIAHTHEFSSISLPLLLSHSILSL